MKLFFEGWHLKTFLSQVDPNALIGDKLKAMSEALATGEPLPEIDNDDLGQVSSTIYNEDLVPLS